LESKRALQLTEEQRARLAHIASMVRFKKGASIYREGDRADAVFNIISGVVKTQKSLPDGTRRIAAFLFEEDIFGLSEAGKYTNSAEAVTLVTAYRLPVSALETVLRGDTALEFHVICKLCHDLREAQRHAYLLGRHDALGRVVMFLQMLERIQVVKGESATELSLPMNRSEIADYIGISLEAVSRSFRTLTDRGVIAFRNKRHLRIIDRGQFENLASQQDMSSVPQPPSK
jgi:CRP/FNR family transcriptional regulator